MGVNSRDYGGGSFDEANKSNNTTRKTLTIQDCSSTPDPVCGNDQIEEGESCDDGNTASGDGCSETCQLENTPPDIPVVGNKESLVIDPQVNQDLATIFTDKQAISEEYFQSGVSLDLTIPELSGSSASLSITYVSETADYQNTFGFLIYDDLNQDGLITEEEINFKQVIYQNVSDVSEGGTLANGDTVSLDSLSPGSKIGFYLISDGATSNPKETYFTIENLNSDSKKHVVAILGSDQNSILLGIEDQKNLGDRDFDDILFVVTSKVDGLISEIAKQANLPQAK
jgi:cysteine-rich repeat protein